MDGERLVYTPTNHSKQKYVLGLTIVVLLLIGAFIFFGRKNSNTVSVNSKTQPRSVSTALPSGSPNLAPIHTIVIGAGELPIKTAVADYPKLSQLLSDWRKEAMAQNPKYGQIHDFIVILRNTGEQGQIKTNESVPNTNIKLASSIRVNNSILITEVYLNGLQSITKPVEATINKLILKSIYGYFFEERSSFDTIYDTKLKNTTYFSISQ